MTSLLINTACLVEHMLRAGMLLEVNNILCVLRKGLAAKFDRRKNTLTNQPAQSIFRNVVTFCKQTAVGCGYGCRVVETTLRDTDT